MKAIITAAGKGSRMNPSTKAIPKGLLPLFSKIDNKVVVVPIIRLITEELSSAGVDDLCMVVGEKKDPLITYVLGEGMKATFVQQPSPIGFADAVARAKDFTRGEPFFVHADDGLVYSESRNPLLNMKEELDAGADAVLLVRQVEKPRGGVVLGKEVGDRIEVEEAYEKLPNPPSSLSIVATYAFSGRAMDYISKVGVGATGEAELTDAISRLAKDGRVVAIKLRNDEVWLNVGNPESYHAALEISYGLAKGLRLAQALSLVKSIDLLAQGT